MNPRTRHEDFLRRLATGDVDPASEAAQRHLRECGGCAERWRELSHLIHSLEGADAERRELVALVGEPTDRDIANTRRAAVTAGVLVAGAADAPPRRRPILLWIAAAAAVAAVFFATRPPTTRLPTYDPGQMLSTSDPRIRAAGDAFGPEGVEIDYRLGPGWSFRIDVEGSSAAGEPVAVSVDHWDRHYRPDPALLARLSGRVLIRVQPLDSNHAPQGSPFARELSVSR